MKLTCSNIAWESNDMENHLKILKDNNIDGIELSPSMIWPEPGEVKEKEILEYKELLNTFQLKTVSMHSLTYTKKHYNMFGDSVHTKELVNYIKKLAELSSKLNCPHMIYGSGGTRNIPKEIEIDHKSKIIKVFSEMAKRCSDYAVNLLIEPLDKIETDLINTVSEGAKLVQEVNHPNFGLHVDLKSTFTQKESQSLIWRKYGSVIQHCHVSNPNLFPPNSDCSEHDLASEAMMNSTYNRYLSIEMRRIKGQTIGELEQAIKFCRVKYQID